MKKATLLLYILFIGLHSWAQEAAKPAATKAKKPHYAYTGAATHIPHTYTATIALGISDPNRHNITVPSTFTSNNIKGFAPIYLKAAYALNSEYSLAVQVATNRIYHDYYHTYYSNGNRFKRYGTETIRIRCYGLSAQYHLNKWLPTKRMDVFAEVGLLMQNIRYTDHPQGDSLINSLERKTSPVLKIGARYFITNNTSLYVDAGIDQLSFLALGCSYRFKK